MTRFIISRPCHSVTKQLSYTHSAPSSNSTPLAPSTTHLLGDGEPNEAAVIHPFCLLLQLHVIVWSLHGNGTYLKALRLVGDSYLRVPLQEMAPLQLAGLVHVVNGGLLLLLADTGTLLGLLRSGRVSSIAALVVAGTVVLETWEEDNNTRSKMGDPPSLLNRHFFIACLKCVRNCSLLLK